MYAWAPSVDLSLVERKLSVMCPPPEPSPIRIEVGKFGYVVVFPDSGSVIVTDLGTPVEVDAGGLPIFQKKLGLLKPDFVVQITSQKFTLGEEVVIFLGQMKRSNGSNVCSFCLIRWLAYTSTHHGDDAADSMARQLELPSQATEIPLTLPPRKDRSEDRDESTRRYIAVLLVRALQSNT